ncbi:MAG TPA: fibronectin type III domain-containing protein, partial [bacterium]|nr:fibronectin type III domain-containing protein [bacterium]
VHMNSLGMHTFFRRTASVNSVYDNTVRFIGNYPSLVDASWEHEFIRDRGFAILWSRIVPPTPVLMMDMKHDTMWTVSMMNYTDLENRLSAASRLDRAGAPGSGRVSAKLIYPYANPSPDFTKACFASSMLALGHPEYEYGDAYIAVARYPQPPAGLKFEGNRLKWEAPAYSSEIKGYNLYRSKESGMNYEKVNREPIKGNSSEISLQNGDFYIMTSVEHSGLESRMFSNEVCTRTPGIYRLFYEAETGDIKNPMVPFFEPAGASNAYAAAITDPELIYREKLESGLKGNVTFRVSVPVSGQARIIARVRGMSRIECSSYTTGWMEKGEADKGVFSIRIDEKSAGKIPVEKSGWKWVVIDNMNLSLNAGEHKIEFETQDAGIAIDNILVTNDTGFIPSGRSNTPSTAPSTPSGLKVTGQVLQGKNLDWQGYSVKPPYLKLTWNPSTALQGVRYYNIYRSENPDFKTEQANLVGSTTEPLFIDCVLEPAKGYYYRVQAVDSWDNRSPGSDTLKVTIK